MITRILGVDPGCAWTGFAVLEMEARLLLPVPEPAAAFWILGAHSVNEMVCGVSREVQKFCQQTGPELVIAMESSIPSRRVLRQWEHTAQVRGAVKTIAGLFGPARVIEITPTEVRSGLSVPPLSKTDHLLRKLGGSHAFCRSMDARVRSQFCLVTGLEEKIFKGKTGCHKVDAGAAALVTAWKHFGAQNERLVA